jgi:23S rRNA pseudouridine2605 synthase
MSKTPQNPAKSEFEGERIAKAIARAGICSRRDAEVMIAEGRVIVNGKKIASPALNVTERDDIRIDGKPLPQPERTRLFRYYKPRGLVTTAKDPEGRPTVFDSLPEGLPRVISVGRLDLNSEGLLLLTNDGELARKLELPATGWVRRYRVRINGDVEESHLAQLNRGIEVDGVRYGAIQATLDRQKGDNSWLTMSLTEGKNREIRKICAHFGWPVSRLIRVAYGPFQIGHLDKGDIEEVPGKVLREQLGQAKEKSAPPSAKNVKHEVKGQLRLKRKAQGDRPREDARKPDGAHQDAPRKASFGKDSPRQDQRGRNDAGRRAGFGKSRRPSR